MPDEVVGGGTWVLRGTETQNAILRPVFQSGSASYVAFPWERIRSAQALPRFPVPISWDDLNDGTFGEREAKPGVMVADAGFRRPLNPHLVRGEEEGHTISRPSDWFGETKGRFMTAGVFWTDGRIKIDIRLEGKPDNAREVLSAEIAHAVDYGLPLSEAQKTAIMRLFHGGGTDAHTWWERIDYSSEYYTLVGESWMALFTHSFSNMEPWQDPFEHKSARAMALDVHRILGIAPVGTGPLPFELRGRAWRTRYGNAYAELTWNGADGERASVWRNGTRVMTTRNDGRFVNFLGGRHGSFSYVLVDAGGRWSNEVTLTV